MDENKLKRLLSISNDQVVLNLLVQPGAQKTTWAGTLEHENRCYLKLRLKAKPIEGQANKELIEFLSKFLSVSRLNLAIKQGEHSRYKLVVIQGNVTEILGKLEPLTSDRTNV